MSEATKYLETLFALAPELGDELNKLTNYHRKRLWHQLTLTLTDFVKNPIAKKQLNLVELYTKFIFSFETRLNQLTLVRLAADVSLDLPGDERIAFLKEVSDKPKVVINNEAFVHSRSVLAEILILNGRYEDAKEVLTAAKKTLDNTAGADASVYSNYFKSWAAYYKTQNEPEEFYKSALQYVAYTNIENISKTDLSDLAFDMCIAALLGEKIFTFEDLLEHPVVESLQGTEHQWLAEVIYTFNKGDIAKWKDLQSVHAEHLNKQPALREKYLLLNQKIAVMSLVDLAFHRGTEDRNIPFTDIAKACHLALDEVEMLVMRTLSLGLIRGTIDEVDGIVSVSWVQPRILDKDQIKVMNQRLEDWQEKVKSAIRVMESGLTSELVA